MNKKIILLIGLFLNISIAHSMELPTMQEVLATNNPLTLALYALRAHYLENPVIPKDATFEERLCKHVLVQDRWLESKGFVGDLQKLHQAKSSLEDVRMAIEKNWSYQNFANFNMQITQKLLMSNLLQAYKDCSGLSNPKP